MENTKSNACNRFYLVSFGDSRQYSLVYADNDLSAEPWHSAHPVEEVEKTLKKCLSEKFPEEKGLAYFTTPKLVEIAWEHREKYAGYPPLDSAAVKDIENVLIKEISDRNEVAELNDDAPFSEV